MAQWNQTEKILHTKVVYYGPALSGKTTNLRQIHRFTDPRGENRLISLNTASDRTLFFDLLPLDLGRISGHAVKVQLYTVPGQIRYDATRRVVLSGADAVVFVADSQPGKGPENRAAWENLKTNLKANGLDPSTVPIVLQYNKQDLDGRLLPSEIEASLRSGQDGISASALRGTGVMETFRIAVLQMLRRLSSITGRRRSEEIAELEEQALRALDRCLGERPAHLDSESLPQVGAVDSPTTIHFEEDGAGEDLLARSLQANLGIAEQFAEMREVKTRLQRRIGELEGLHSLTRQLSKHGEVKSILDDLADAAQSIPGARGVSLLTRESEGVALMPKVLRSLDRDPLTRGGTSPEFAEDLLLRGEAKLLDSLPQTSAVDGPLGHSTVCAAIAVPMYPVLRQPFLLMVYGDAPFGPDDLRFLEVLSAHAAVCLDNATMTRRLTAYNERLEKEVRERTRQIEAANEELRELDGMKDRFLSSVSHEMKTPLTGIISGAELLASLTPEGDERREFVAMVAEEGRKLDSLVDQILRFQALGRRTADEARERIDPLDLLASQLHEITPAIAARKIRLTTSLPERLPSITGDSESLRLALREILANAVKFTPEGGQVWVRAREEGPASASSKGGAPRFSLGSGEFASRPIVVISVGDSGPGIPHEQHARIFERFEQLGNILTSKPEGLGLGLPIAKAIAVRHGGDLRVESELGAGSEFHLLLPIAASHAPERLEVKVGARG